MHKYCSVLLSALLAISCTDRQALTVTDTDEAAAWGAALCAGAAVGAFEKFDADPRDLDAISTTYQPDPARATHYHERYAVYRDIAGEMTASWGRLNELDKKVRGAQ